MKRLPITGASIFSPAASLGNLKSCLERLGVAQVYDDSQAHELYYKLGAINGAWIANEESKQSSSVAKELLAISKSLDASVRFLSGHDTGIRNLVDIQSTSLISNFLALDQTLEEKPQELIARFRGDAARIAHASLIAYTDLSQKTGEVGRDALIWYNQFTAVLLEIAQKVNVRPTLGYDSINNIPCGWLFEAAQEFEEFLYSPMRSDTMQTCKTRLDRSLKRLRRSHTQNSPTAA